MLTDNRNAEHYDDPTAAAAMRRVQAADGARKKALYLIDALKQISRLAGFRIIGAITLRDRAGRIYNSDKLCASETAPNAGGHEQCGEPAADVDEFTNQTNSV